MTNPTLERAARAAGDVAATMESDVHHLLSERALTDIARAVLMAVRPHDVPSWAHFEQEAWRDGIDTILKEES